jgi:sigma-E factor negative regulatory protein RseA
MQVATHSVQEQEQLSWEAQVSTWVDAEGDIRPEDLDSPYGRHLWDTYHLIGDVLRSEELAIRPTDLFYARVSKAIDAEPPIVAVASRKHAKLRRGLSGLAVAAAVASVMWVTLPYFSGNGAGSTQVQVVAGADNPAGSSESAGSADVDVGLRDYLDAHRQIAGVSPVRQASFDLGTSR